MKTVPVAAAHEQLGIEPTLDHVGSSPFTGDERVVAEMPPEIVVELHYDFWWHLGYDTLITSEWGTPNMVEGGLDPELLMGRRYGHRLHLWDLRRRQHTQTLDLGDEHQIVLELRPAHDPTKDFGFVNVVVNVTDLTSSIWTWYRTADGSWTVEKTIEIPPESAETDQLPPALQPFGAAPPLVS